MRKIKFSHQYKKMPLTLEPTYVLDVWALRKEALSKAFIDFDTKIGDKYDKSEKNQHYKLNPSDVYLVIMLWSSGLLWTTIRTATKEKHDYYKSLIGQEVKIEVKK